MKVLPVPNETKVRRLSEGETEDFEYLYKRYLIENERNQRTYVMVYGTSSPYLEKHKQVFTWIRKNREYFTTEQEHFLLYNLFCRNVIDLWHKRIKGKIKQAKTCKTVFPSKLNSNVRVGETCYSGFYSSQVDAKKTLSAEKSSFVFNYSTNQLIDVCPKEGLIIDLFNKDQVVCCSHLSANSKLRFIHDVIKLFPSAYMITMDSPFMTNLMKKRDLEIGVIRSRDTYKCTLKVRTEKASGIETSLFSEKRARIWDKRRCKLNGKQYQDFLEKYECPLYCKYHLDRLKCSRSHTVGIRPLTFLVDTTFTTGATMFKPRSLIIVDNVKLLMDSLKKFGTFEVPEVDCVHLDFDKGFKKILQILLNREIYRAKTYEKQGWLVLMEHLRNTPPKNGLWPSRPHRYYNETQDYLIKILLEENRSCIEGLDSDTYQKLCDTKRAIYAIKLALRAKKPYTMMPVGSKRVFIPKDYKHLVRAHIKPYGSYFLLLNAVNAGHYKADFL